MSKIISEYNQAHGDDTSNEALKTDDEYGMTKSYFLEKNLILSDISLPNDEYEYEIDLDNGWIPKSLSNNKQTTTKDSIQPINPQKLSSRTIISFSIGTIMIIFLILLVFFFL